MTPGFLNAIASYYFQNNKTDVTSYCFVFPSQRAGIFFLNHVRTLTTSPMWAPKTITVNDLFASMSNMVVADNITLLFTLHTVYNNITGKDVSFDDFLPWGEMFLNDFDDLDKYLVPIDQLFSNLASLKELEDDFSHLSDEQREAIQSFWGTFKMERLSNHQKEFLSVWEQVPAIYHAFRETLEAQGLAYDGMVYRKLAESIKNGEHPDIEWDHLVFTGLNALTPAERELMKYLKKKKKADFFWDYSTWIIPQEPVLKSYGSTQRGPGLFLKENLASFPMPDGFILPLNETGPEITITAVANPTEQLKSVNQFLTEEYVTDMKTAVILADENMLMPALHGIPENVDRINVTMGYPLKSTPIFGLADLLFDLQRNARQTGKQETWLYHRHVIPILQHPYIAMLADEDARQLRKQVIKKNYIFINSTELHSNALFKLIFTATSTGEELADYMNDILTKVYELLHQSGDNIIEQEFVFTLHKSIIRLQDILEQNQNASLEPQTWIKLFRKLADFQTVPFKGEPLAGLQVMGILETRALDFDKLIILDLNEGVFPRSSPPNTFIPSALRAGFGLPTIEFQDTIFSYYFFRLIHRAKKVQLLYSTGAQGLKSNEMSRYLYQLKYEYPTNPVFQTAPGHVSLLNSPQPFAPKDETVMKRLAKFHPDNGAMLSPSALSVYIDCPLRFYYQKIARIKEPDLITEEADARIFGLIFHEVVENLYKPYIGKEVQKDTLSAWLETPELLEQLIREGFDKHLTDYEKGRTTFSDIHGKNVMVYEVLKRYLHRFLQLEKEAAPFTIVDLEQRVNWSYTTSNGTTVNLGGIIDRLEQKDGVLKVMDYKTGSGEPHTADIKDLFNTDKHKKNKAIFQTLLYSLILYKTTAPEASIQPGVIWVRDLFKKDYDTGLYLKNRKSKSLIELSAVRLDFEANLDDLLNELYDPEVPFSPTEDPMKCSYCTYKDLCNK
ncbi:MAG: PD-(D/E)XK nuclease family protein [Marinilabiliaceae bacterium]|nr:PD-(D/E)XK nuclease family protein [Marinilabiliaceae bacterium]